MKARMPYRPIAGQKSSRRSLIFQPVNFSGSQRLVTTLWLGKGKGVGRVVGGVLFVPCIQFSCDTHCLKKNAGKQGPVNR